MVPNKAFVLAAGKGSRMRPLTDTCPKPLLEVNGKPMVDRALDALEIAGVDESIVNLCYLGEQLENHLSNRRVSPDITFSWEEELLDTGGGVKKELTFFDNKPFYVLNADIVWTEKNTPVLQRLSDMWDEDKMDILLMLYPVNRLNDLESKGDYHISEDGKLTFAGEGKLADYIFAGPRIVSPYIFKDSPDEAFSFLELFHKAEAEGRLYGLVHEGEWFHVGTPEALDETNKIFQDRGLV